MGSQERIGLEAVLVTKQFEKGLKLYTQGQKKIQTDTAKTAQSAKKSTDVLGNAFSSLGTKIAAFGATALTGQALLQFGVQSFQASASAERLGVATDNLGKRFGISGDQIVASIQKASGFTISRLDAMRQANQAMLLGVAQNEGQFARMTEIAVVLGRAMGQNAAKSVEDLTIALGRQSPLILDNLGINLKLSEAYDLYAETLGKTASQLTDTEKKQAFLVEALRKGEDAVAQIGGVTTDTAAGLEQLSAGFSDFQVAFGGFLTQAAQSSGVFDTVNEGLRSWTFILGEAVPAIQAANEAQKQQQEQLDTTAGTALATAQNIDQMREAVEGTSTSFQEIGIGVAEASGTFDEYNQNLDRLSNINADALGSFGSLISEISLTEKEFNELKAALEKERVAQEKANQARSRSAESLRLSGLAATFATAGIEDETEALAGLSEELQRQIALGPEFLSTQEKIQVVLAKNSEQIEVQAARMSGLAASFGAAADFTRVTPEEAIAAQQPEVEVKIDAKKVGSSISSAISDQLQSIKSAISQVSGLTFGEILPPQETFRVDEWARRMAAVATDGKNQWVGAIVEQFGGQEFLRPLEEAIAAGDTAGIQTAAQGILDGEGLFQLMDIEGAVTQVEGLIAEQNLQQRINDAILAAITGEGGELPAGMGIGGGPILNAIGLGEGADPGAAIGTAVSELGIPGIINEALVADTGGEGINPLLSLLGLGEDGAFDDAIATLTGETIPSIGIAFTNFFTNASQGFQQMLLDTQTEDIALVNMATTTMPQLQSAIITTSGVFIAKFNEINKAIDGSNKVMQKLRKTIGEEIVEALKDAKEATDDWIKSLERAVTVRGDLAPKGVGTGAAAGIGFRNGVGFQQGTPPLGFRVPAGFPNDTFPINVTSGEKVVVSPPGRSIEDVTGIGAPRVEVNINGVSISNGMDLNMFEGRVTRAVTEGFSQ